MPEYHVSWEIDAFPADSPADAAQAVHEMMLDPTSIALVFFVTDEDGNRTKVDLWDRSADNTDSVKSTEGDGNNPHAAALTLRHEANAQGYTAASIWMGSGSPELRDRFVTLSNEAAIEFAKLAYDNGDNDWRADAGLAAATVIEGWTEADNDDEDRGWLASERHRAAYAKSPEDRSFAEQEMAADIAGAIVRAGGDDGDFPWLDNPAPPRLLKLHRVLFENGDEVNVMAFDRDDAERRTNTPERGGAYSVIDLIEFPDGPTNSKDNA